MLHERPPILGIDSLVVSNPPMFARAGSDGMLGQSPAFWGRYFHAPGQKNARGQVVSHYSAAENAFLRSKFVRVLPVARQTVHVGGDGETGAEHARLNVEAIFETFPAGYLAGACPNPLVFLDVEPTHPLSPDYYLGWSAALMDHSTERSNGGVRMRPAIYAGVKNAPAWAGLTQAMGRGALCYGAFVARYKFGTPIPNGWHPDVTTPDGGILPPILAWQYWACPDGASAEQNFDANIASPFHSDVLMGGLILPPGPLPAIEVAPDV